MHGSPAYNTDFIGGLASLPLATASIQKLGNGYVVHFSTCPKGPKPSQVRYTPSPFAGHDPDELIDRMIDGLGAFVRSINDKGAGEEWKDEENRKQVRESFRIMFPSMSNQIDQMVSEIDQIIAEEPRNEQLVFESKAALLEYLTKNL